MYRKANEDWTKHMDFILWDLTCLYLSFFLVYCVRNKSVDLFGNPLYGCMVLVLFCAQFFCEYILQFI